ncbi:MAG: FtsX-like permease family protein, partial [Bacteroidota bacterium]
GQYAVSICLMVSAWIFSQNSDYFGTIDLHYNHKDIVMLPLDRAEDYVVVKNELSSMSLINEVIGTSGHHGTSWKRKAFNTDTTDIEVVSFQVSPEYLSTMEIDIVEGRDFITNSQAEFNNSIIVNKEFAKRYLSEVATVDYQISIDDQKRNIVGVCDDIIHEIYYDYRPTPMIYLPTPESKYDVIIAKTSNGQTDQLERELQAVWANMFDTPYRGKPQTMVSSFYASRDARNLKLIFTSIAILGSMLSLIGIFSLASLNVSKRTKEISIRKVLGATIQQIMLVVNRSFLKLLGLALIIGVAVGMWLSEAVLEMIYMFYQSGSIFESVGIGMVVIAVAILFISLAAFRPVMANPSEGLRTE